MKVLIVKTSSMGDLIHTLPALTDAARHITNIEFDWVSESGFAEIPKWHPNVNEVIKVSLRRWRKQPIAALKSGELKEFRQKLRSKRYDYVIDAQSLLKSAIITRLAHGTRCGLDHASARESIAHRFYQNSYEVKKGLHAIQRVRELMAKSLGYPMPLSDPDYGLDHVRWPALSYDSPYVVFIHGTTWQSKLWPETYWVEAAKLAVQQGMTVYLPWGNQEEHDRANAIAAHHEKIKVLPRLSLTNLAALLSAAQGVISVDTGLGHLSAALSVPAVSLYGPTDPVKIGTLGKNQVHLAMDFECAPCYQKTCQYKGEGAITPFCFSMNPPETVWKTLKKEMSYDECHTTNN